jgi:membrane-associated phospholipid phosphatase
MSSTFISRWERLRAPAIVGKQQRWWTSVVITVALVQLAVGGVWAQPAATPSGLPSRSAAADQTEPRAGTWTTWVLATGSQARPAAPPDTATSQAEVRQLKALVAQRDAAARERIAFWDTGAPSYRWNELTVKEALKHNLNTNYALRALALVHVAIADAMVAAWDAKYAYQRPRPSELGASLETVLPNPASPSYPSEHAVAAGAAATVLAYVFPDDEQLFADLSEEAGRSRLLAGVDYPSDVASGLELGRAVAALVVERGKADGANAVWTGSVPAEPGHWSGTNPIMPLAGTWRTWVLESGSELRPGPPPAYDSAEEAAELAELKSVQRTPKTNADAFFWEYGSGGARNYWFWNEQTSKQILEYRLDANPPRAARAYALESVASYDTGVACWDAKYAYWAIRPFQLDPTVQPLFPTPNHPSYPAAHGCFSSAAAAALAHLFPHDAQSLNALADEAGESRIWAGIHFRSDVTTGLALGRAVAAKVIERARSDGAE